MDELQTQPLGPETTDEEIINDTSEEPQLLTDTDEARIYLSLAQDYEAAEEGARLPLVKELRKHLRYWDDYQYLAWDEVAHDWRTPEEIVEENPTSDIDPDIYAKVVNIYKAHGEILIGALSASVPTIRFFPEDADSYEDIQTAKAYSKISELIKRQNRAKLLMMKALYILYNQGLVACYNENKTDSRFGTVKRPDYQDVQTTNRDYYCPMCNFEFGSQQFGPEDVPSQMSEQDCPQCHNLVAPEHEESQSVENMQVGEIEEPKQQECLELYGPLNVKIPLWVREQGATPYLRLDTEESVALLREIYPELADRIGESGYPDTFDRETRVPNTYIGDFPRNMATVSRIWFRPWAFNLYDRDVELVKSLKEKYKDGVYVVIINNTLVAEAIADKLDDHWTIAENPLAETLHPRPQGAAMVPLQDIENELTNITLDTIEFGIGEVFADGQVLDFDAYPKQESRPGQITQATAPTGSNLAAGFHEVKPASLSQEVGVFAERMNQRQQFVLGTYPSIYGGAVQGSGGTAKEYEMSKASALQRLSSQWTIIQEWWARVMDKATRSHVKNMKADESFVQSHGDNFVNIVIRQSELTGKIGDVLPEVSEAFPVSWSQKRDILLSLLQMKDERIMEVISHPENAGNVATLIGVPELYIPGDDDRDKQLYEISILLKEQPEEGAQGLISTVAVDPTLDRHAIEAEICRSWLISPEGLDAKRNNPSGYANVLAHYREHMFFQAQEESAQAASESTNGDKNKDKNGQQEKKGVGDVQEVGA